MAHGVQVVLWFIISLGFDTGARLRWGLGEKTNIEINGTWTFGDS